MCYGVDYTLRRPAIGKEEGMSKRTSNGRGTGVFVATILCLSVVFVAHADPPVGPPCALEMDPVFCFRMTFVQRDAALDRWKFEFEFLNWSNFKAFGLVLERNEPCAVGGGPPIFDGAEIDVDGTPIDPHDNCLSGSCRPPLNQDIPNN